MWPIPTPKAPRGSRLRKLRKDLVKPVTVSQRLANTLAAEASNPLRRLHPPGDLLEIWPRGGFCRQPWVSLEPLLYPETLPQGLHCCRQAVHTPPISGGLPLPIQNGLQDFLCSATHSELPSTGWAHRQHPTPTRCASQDPCDRKISPNSN